MRARVSSNNSIRKDTGERETEYDCECQYKVECKSECEVECKSKSEG